MKRNLLPLAAWMTALVGCSPEQYSRSLVCHGSLAGGLRQSLLGEPEKMIRRGKIDLHRRIETDPGVTIDVWAIRSRKDTSRGTALLLHGLWDSKARFLGLGRRLADEGFDVILPDNRCHGRSTGKYLTWGVKEKHDLIRVVDALTRPGGLSPRVYVFGMSMGGCIATQYALADERCKAAMLVAPAAGATQVLRRMFPWIGPKRIEQTRQHLLTMAGFDLHEASAIEAAGRLDKPLIVVHGCLDATVPYRHGKAVFEACPGPKRFYPVWWAGHATILLAREKWFAERMIELAETEVSSPQSILPSDARQESGASGRES
jgi:hypothetical protein